MYEFVTSTAYIVASILVFVSAFLDAMDKLSNASHENGTGWLPDGLSTTFAFLLALALGLLWPVTLAANLFFAVKNGASNR